MLEVHSLLEGLKKAHSITAEQIELMYKHLCFVLEKNKTLNLTSITEQTRAICLHLEDSLLGLEHVAASKEGLLVDIGSGGGFPGITLAIATKRPAFLVESTYKKAKALEVFVIDLELQSQITVLPQRVEELAAKRKRIAAVVTARALAELPVLLEYAEPLLEIGGTLVAYKGVLSKHEQGRGNIAAEMLGFSQGEPSSYLLGKEGVVRTIVRFQKIKESKKVLPRRIGMATKRPLA